MADTTLDIIAALMDPEIYEHPVEQVEVLQTHISWVVLAGELVYKIKKPVDFGFLKFSTLADRQHFCQQEVDLNSRLCPDLYLGVVEVRDEAGTISLGGDSGQVVEYAVQMRRLPEDRMLDSLLAAGNVPESAVDEIAGILADFHQRSTSGADIERYGSETIIQENWVENFNQTHDFIDVTISRAQYDYLCAWVAATLVGNREVFKDRVSEGHIRDGHGDLRASAICLDNTVCIFDCIEFNERFRFGDVASDVAFLAMDLSAKGRPDLAERFVSSYVNASGDTSLVNVIDFYICYRAYVRGKIESFTSVDPGVPEAERQESAATARARFAQAVASANRVQPPVLLITCGLSATGKSEIAATIAKHSGYVVISSDVVRKQIAGIDPDHRDPVDFGTGIYSSDFTQKTYREMLDRAEALLGGGASVVLDATFASKEWRSAAENLARRSGALMLCLECRTDEEVVRERIGARDLGGKTHSDATWDTYLGQRELFEPVDELSGWQHIVLDTSGSIHQTRLDAIRLVEKRVSPPGIRDGQD